MNTGEKNIAHSLVQFSNSRHFLCMEKDVCTVLLVVLPVPKWKRSMPCISNTIVILFATLALLLMLSTLCHTTFAPLYLNCIAPFSYPPFPTVHLAISSSFPSSERRSAQPHPCQDLSLHQWLPLSFLLSHSSSVASFSRQSAAQVSIPFWIFPLF